MNQSSHHLYRPESYPTQEQYVLCYNHKQENNNVIYPYEGISDH